MIGRVDAAVLRRVQAVADWVHGWTGWDCLQQARGLYGLAAIGVLWMSAVPVAPRPAVWERAALLLAFVCLAFCETRGDRLVRAEALGGLRNWRRANPLYRFGRLLTLTCVPLIPLAPLFGDWPFFCFVVPVATVVWWECCDVLPARTAA